MSKIEKTNSKLEEGDEKIDISIGGKCLLQIMGAPLTFQFRNLITGKFLAAQLTNMGSNAAQLTNMGSNFEVEEGFDEEEEREEHMVSG